ncbi:MAG TPA: DUF3175 domain-containing protein [Thermoanaerobaculia bacterium]
MPRGVRVLQSKAGVAKSGSRWSQRVTRESNALDLESGVFSLDSPRKIALSLQRSAERSRRRKAGAYASAMSMLTFYINRAGSTLSGARRRRLEKAKAELRALYGRGPGGPSKAGARGARRGPRI